MKDLETRSVQIDLNPIEEGSRTLEGYAHIFETNYTKLKDRWGDVFCEKVLPGAFLKTIADQTRDKFFLVNHDWNKVVGRTSSNLELREDEKGLYFKMEVPNTTDGNDLLENVRMGLIQGCSFGFNILNSIEKWNEDYTEFYRDITEVDLYEITATPLPCYENTEIHARSQTSIKDIRPKVNTPEEPKSDEVTNERSKNILLSFLSGLADINIKK